jgi:hypothetical protein
MILKRKVIEELSKKLLLPFTGIEQDWELEMANLERIDEFLNFYKKSVLSTDEKIALMCLILASYDDLLNEKKLEVDNRWNEIKELLELDRVLFIELLDYWALNDELGKENLFKITPLVRSIGD